MIVLDEPFSGLDPLVRDDLIESLLDRAAEDANPPTILISSHDLAEVETLASHVGYLDRGHLLFSEEISMLVSRFREVTVTMDADVAATSNAVPAGRAGHIAPSLRTVSYPASWLVPEISASVVRLIHIHADTEPVDEQILAHFPEATEIQLEAMSLRSIFLALARSTRPTAAEIWSQV